MRREEFLEILRNQLSGQMQEGRVAAHVRYYEDYIQSQVRGGKDEQEVLAALGDPRLIAKTLLDTDIQDSYGYDDREYTSYSQSDENPETSVHKTHRLDLSTWYGKAAFLGGAVVVVALLCAALKAVLPFFITLAVVLCIISWLKKRIS